MVRIDSRRDSVRPPRVTRDCDCAFRCKRSRAARTPCAAVRHNGEKSPVIDHGCTGYAGNTMQRVGTPFAGTPRLGTMNDSIYYGCVKRPSAIERVAIGIGAPFSVTYRVCRKDAHARTGQRLQHFYLPLSSESDRRRRTCLPKIADRQVSPVGHGCVTRFIGKTGQDRCNFFSHRLYLDKMRHAGVIPCFFPPLYRLIRTKLGRKGKTRCY